jgi:hypothetical protein
MTENNTVPDLVDICVTAKACKPLSGGRRAWAPIKLKFNRSTGLAALKGEIERRLEQNIKFNLKANNEKEFYYAKDEYITTDRLLVKLWTYLEPLYGQPTAASAQRNYKEISTSQELHSMLELLGLTRLKERVLHLEAQILVGQKRPYK